MRAVALLAAAASLAASAQYYGLTPNPPPAPPAPAQPPHATTKVEGSDNVYIFRNGNTQSMFVVSRDGVIATDPNGYGKPGAAAEKEFRLAGLEHWANHAQARPFWATRYCALWGRGF